MKSRHVFSVGAVIAFALVACNQNAVLESPKVLGLLELNVGNGFVAQAKFTPSGLHTQAILNESQLVFTPSANAVIVTETNGTRTFDYVSRNFTITNNSGASISNLTLVALAKTGNLGGTAIKSATSFNGNTTDTTTAQAARPTHTMIASGGGVVVDTADISRASFQALTTAEATAIQNDANFASQGLTGTVLEYGFVATNATATNRTITNGSNGKVSIAMRFPKPTTATNTYNFVMTFAVMAESTNRVTRSPEETLANAQSRATTLGATQTVQIDNPSVVTPTSSVPVYNNIKIGTGATQTLLKNAGKVVVARVSPGGGTGGSVYTKDFVEIFNAGEFSVSASSKSLQYATAGGDIGTSPNTIDISSLGIIPPGGYRLITTVFQGTATNSLTSDLSTEWNINFNTLSGNKMAIVNQTTALGCGSTATACNATQNGLIVDLLGSQRSGTASKFEGTGAFVYISGNGDVAFDRKNNGCTDTDQNSTDFSEAVLISTSARSSATTRFICP